jgi:hypothetical protein
MMVMMMAITPSLNASSRDLLIFMTTPRRLRIHDSTCVGQVEIA